MRHPSSPTGNNNGNAHHTRNRGALRTHLGRKRVGPRARPPREAAFGGAASLESRRREEDVFDRLLDAFQQVFAKAGETTAAAFESALDAACDTLVSASEFTADNAQRLRECLRRDLLQRDHPAMTFRTGDITSAGTLTCAGCGWTVRTTRTTVLPPCPQCTQTAFRKSD